MALDMVTLKKTLHNWVYGFTGKKTIYEDPNAPRPAQEAAPSVPYLTLKIIAMVPIGQDFFRAVNPTTGNAQVVGTRRITLQINHYGPDSFMTLESLYASLIMPEYQQLLNAQGITQLDRFAITDLSGLDDTKFEERAVVDFWFLVGSLSSDVEDIGVIEAVEMEETIKNPDLTIAKQQTILVDTR